MTCLTKEQLEKINKKIMEGETGYELEKYKKGFGVIIMITRIEPLKKWGNDLIMEIDHYGNILNSELYDVLAEQQASKIIDHFIFGDESEYKVKILDAYEFMIKTFMMEIDYLKEEKERLIKVGTYDYPQHMDIVEILKRMPI